MNDLLEVEGLTKQFDDFLLNNLSFTLPKGFIMGFIGPNGSGKTTTIKLILNMLNRTSGKIKVLGLDNVDNEVLVKENIGGVFDSNYLLDNWTLIDVEIALGMLYKNWDKNKYMSMLNKFKLYPKKQVKELSKGMQMKLMLACAFSHDTKLLILDEPTSGLDPIARDELLDILSEYISDGERSVFFSTHITQDLYKIADYITYINNGKLIYTGTKDDFINNYRIVKGDIKTLTQEQIDHIIGLRRYSSGYEGLIEKGHLRLFKNELCENVVLDDILVFQSREVCNG
ncbi:MAG: ABC-type multidrug transport system, ATPase component [Haloplasmataceae bacterium]|nr:ABC-type multidrug transport system, ATPase component [Haloplasmataceae bacterium]